MTLAMPPFQKFVKRCVCTVTGNVHVKNEVRRSNTTDRMRHNIHGVKLTPASRRRYKIGLPVEGLNKLYEVIISLVQEAQLPQRNSASAAHMEGGWG